MTPRKRFIRIVARGSLIAGVLFLLLITGLLVFLNVRHQQIVVLPIPTGP